jgi:hypothetical protein
MCVEGTRSSSDGIEMPKPIRGAKWVVVSCWLWSLASCGLLLGLSLLRLGRSLVVESNLRSLVVEQGVECHLHLQDERWVHQIELSSLVSFIVVRCSGSDICCVI